ncbi:phage tail protein [Vibrio campbellii]|uniref:phage tail-collar fiber domain-containing protein n=1 Tax=Vibrio campbellii TaxID=680 RepID=UPI0009B77EF0|nr:phage tail protein [Vibrio campbellii]
MTNTTDKSILTAAGKALLAQLNAEEKPLIIDKMIFANVPNRPEFPQPDDVVPTDHVVHQEGVEQRGRLSADSVIYSSTLTSDVGPFDFNWTGAYCSEYGVLVTIDHHALTPKTADEPGVAGNTLVRSVVLEYKDIAEITNITVDASTWQYNATPRMKKMDDDVAQAIIDQNGKDWFIEDGFLVTPQASAFNIKAGAGYVSGNRVMLEFDRNVQVPNKPSFIYVDAHREGTPTGEQVILFDFVITADEKDDYTDANGVKHFVCKVAQVLGDGSVSDLRPEGESASRTWVLDEVKKYSESDTQTKQLVGAEDEIQGVVIDGYSAIKLKKNDEYELWYAWDVPKGVVISFVNNNDYGTAELLARQGDGSNVIFEFVNQRVRNLRTMGYVEGWGADEKALDTYDAHYRAATYCKSKGITLSSNIGLIYNTSKTVDFRDVKSVDYKAQLVGTGNFITLLLGGDSTIEQQYYNQSVHKVNRGGESPAIRIVGSKKSTIRIGEASYVQVWADSSESLGGTQDETSISKIHIQQVRTLEINTNMNPDGENPTNKAWVNSNDFYLQVCDILIVDGIYHHNSNKFHGGNFEAADSKIHFKKGQSNQVKDVRGENDLIVEFDSDTSNNGVITNWTSYPNGFNTAKQIIDNGTNNVVKNVNDLFNMRLVLMAFTSASYKKDTNNNPNMLGLANIDINGPLMSRPAYAMIYKTPLLEISPGSEFFRFYVEGRTVGGVTVKVIGYDESGNLINGKDGDVYFASADNPMARFGQVNNHLDVGSSGQNLFYVMNREAKYIEIECSASAAGVTFKRFCLVATTSNKAGDEYITATGMIPNIS